MFYYKHQHLFWPSMSVNAYYVAKDCTSCARKLVKFGKLVTGLSLFSATEPLALFSIGILGPLLESNEGNTALSVITNRFSKLIKPWFYVPQRNTTLRRPSRNIGVFCVIPEKIPLRWLKKFTAHFCTDVCWILDISNLYTTTYYPQTNGQTERFNRTLLTALRHYVADLPRSWDEFTDAFSYAYNIQAYSGTGFASF